MPARRRFGSVRKLPSGRWQARYLTLNGQQRKAPDTFRTKTDALRYLAGVETDLARGTWFDPTRGDVLLRDYAESWLTHRRVKGKALAPRTRDTYRHSLTAWIEPDLGQVRLAQLTPAVVRTWHARVAERTGPTATRQAYALLRAILTTAVDDGALPRNPCRVPGAGQASSPERPLLDVEAVAKLADAVPAYLRALVLTAFWGHLRLGELLGLRRGDLDLDAGTLTVERQVVELRGQGPVETVPKVGSVRVVHLPVQAREALAEHLAEQGPGLPTARMFRRPDGTALRQHHVEWHWRVARSRAGYPQAHLHDLRHAGLTLAAQSGATLAEVMRRAGHSSSRAAMLYQHAAERRDAEIADRLSGITGVPPSSLRNGTQLARGDQQ